MAAFGVGNLAKARHVVPTIRMTQGIRQPYSYPAVDHVGESPLQAERRCPTRCGWVLAVLHADGSHQPAFGVNHRLLVVTAFLVALGRSRETVGSDRGPPLVGISSGFQQ